MQRMCCSCTAQGSRKKGRSGIEMLELQVCCGAELCDIFMLMQCLCRCVGDVWWLRELAWAWKALQIHQFPSKSKVVQYICCSSDCKATLQSISKPLSPEDKREWFDYGPHENFTYLDFHQGQEWCPLMLVAVFLSLTSQVPS